MANGNQEYRSPRQPEGQPYKAGQDYEQPIAMDDEQYNEVYSGRDPFYERVWSDDYERPIVRRKADYDVQSAKNAEIYKKDASGHYPSRVPSSGLLLKAPWHESYDKMITAEEEMGYEVYQKDGRDYSRPTPQRQAFERIIHNAPKDMASIITKTEGRGNYGLYTFADDSGNRGYVMSEVDKWHKDPTLTMKGSLHKGAVDAYNRENIIDEKSAWKMYKMLNKEGWESKVMRVIGKVFNK